MKKNERAHVQSERVCLVLLETSVYPVRDGEIIRCGRCPDDGH